MSDPMVTFTMMKIGNVSPGGFYFVNVEYNGKNDNSERKFNGRQISRLWSLPSRNTFSIPLDTSLDSQVVKISLCEERADHSLLSVDNRFTVALGSCEVCLDDKYQDYLYDLKVEMTNMMVFHLRCRLEGFGRTDFEKSFPLYQLFSPLFPGYVGLLSQILEFLPFRCLLGVVSLVNKHLYRVSKKVPLKNVVFSRTVVLRNLIRNIRKVKIESLKMSQCSRSTYLQNEKPSGRNRILQKLTILSSGFDYYDIYSLLNYFIRLEELSIFSEHGYAVNNDFKSSNKPFLKFYFPRLRIFQLNSRRLVRNMNFVVELLQKCKRIEIIRLIGDQNFEIVSPDLLDISNEKIEKYYPDIGKWSDYLPFTNTGCVVNMNEIIYYKGVLLRFSFCLNTNKEKQRKTTKDIYEVKIRSLNTNFALNLSICFEIIQFGRVLSRSTYRNHFMSCVDDKHSTFFVKGPVFKEKLHRIRRKLLPLNQTLRIRFKLKRFVPLGEYQARKTDDYPSQFVSQLLEISTEKKSASLSISEEYQNKPKEVHISLDPKKYNFSEFESWIEKRIKVYPELEEKPCWRFSCNYNSDDDNKLEVEFEFLGSSDLIEGDIRIFMIDIDRKSKTCEKKKMFFGNFGKKRVCRFVINDLKVLQEVYITFTPKLIIRKQ